MTCYCTGDIHADHDIRKLGSEYFNKGNELGLTKNDYLIICGDFGLIWNGQWNGEEYWLNWLEEKPWTTLFVDGNHEGFTLLNSYPVEEWNGGKVHRIRDSILHLMRGQVFEIDGQKLFTMGGAYSHDKQYRREGVSWWAEEVPSQEERDEAEANLEVHGWKVDYVFTHEAPTHIAEQLNYMSRDYSRTVDELSRWLESIAYHLDYKVWYNGHHHMDWVFDEGKHQSLYDAIVRVGDMESEGLGKPWRRLSDFW